MQDYTKHFRVAKEVLELHVGGPIILTKFVEVIKGYDLADGEKRKVYQKEAFEQSLSYLYLDNANKFKYGLYGLYGFKYGLILV